MGYGSFNAPLNGLSGWLFQNWECHRVTIAVRFSGSYELIGADEQAAHSLDESTARKREFWGRTNFQPIQKIAAASHT